MPTMLFGIPFLAFAIAWELLSLGMFFDTGVGKVEGPGGIMSYLMPIFGLPFVVVGIGLVGSPIWAARKATRTVHILTDRRLVTAVLGQKLSLKSIDPAGIFDMTREQHGDGIGTITFSLGSYRDSDGDLVEKKEVWLGVAEVKELEERLRDVMAALRKAEGPDQPA